eukprot:130450-Hanusia_phi.AAC.1
MIVPELPAPDLLINLSVYYSRLLSLLRQFESFSTRSPASARPVTELRKLPCTAGPGPGPGPARFQVLLPSCPGQAGNFHSSGRRRA